MDIDRHQYDLGSRIYFDFFFLEFLFFWLHHQSNEKRVSWQQMVQLPNMSGFVHREHLGTLKISLY